MKKYLLIISVVIALVLSSVIAVSADTLEVAGKVYYQKDSMERLTVSSSYSPELSGKVDTSVFFDHSPSSGCTFDFTDSENKSVSILVGSRDSEKLEAFGIIVDIPEGTKLKVTVYGTDDASLTEWTELKVSDASVDDIFTAYTVEGIEKGYAFYRFVFEVVEGDGFSLAELSLLKTAEAVELPQEAVSSVKPLYEREQWRKAKALHF